MPRMFKPEMREICQFVWSKRFPELVMVMDFDWSSQMAQRICNEVLEVHRGVVLCDRKIAKIESLMKYQC